MMRALQLCGGVALASALPHQEGRQLRKLQETAAENGQIKEDCFAALVQQNKAPADVAACVINCMNGATSYGAWYHSGRWSPEQIDADNEIDNSVGTSCVRCTSVLRRCPSGTTSYGDEGRLSHGIDLSASSFLCDGTISWANASAIISTATPRLLLNDFCFPGECSYTDIRDLFEYELIPKLAPRYTNVQARASCDILATFLNDSAPWWILSFGIVWVIMNTFCTRAAPGMILRCLLWGYIAWDVLIGGLMLIFGLFFLFPQKIPQFIKLATPLMGILQMASGLIARCALMGEVELKTGICSWNPFRGKYWVLYLSNVFAGVDGLLALVLAFVFKIGGKDSLESAVNSERTTDPTDALESHEELAELNNTIQTYHTLLVCMLFITAAVQISLVTLSTGAISRFSHVRMRYPRGWCRVARIGNAARLDPVTTPPTCRVPMLGRLRWNQGAPGQGDSLPQARFAGTTNNTHHSISARFARRLGQ